MGEIGCRGLVSTFKKYGVIFAFFAAVAFSSALMMLSGALSDDQITYWYKAKIILESQSGQVWWEPNSTFSFLLAAVFRLLGDVNASFAAMYFFTAYLYLLAMFWSMTYFIKNRFIAVSIAVISLVPRYTLGMTYWGFGGFEFIKARILIMPLVPLLLAAYLFRRNKPDVIVIYLGVAAAAILSFESIYLGLSFCVCSALFVVMNRFMSRQARLLTLVGIGSFMTAAAIIYSYRIIMGKFIGATALVFELPIYEHLKSVLQSEIIRMTSAEYLRLSWAAAYQAFWWALFPPSISDFGLFIGEHIFLIGFGAVGARYLYKINKELFIKIIQLMISVIVVTYCLQIFRLAGRYLFGWPPLILEEVRAFKFMLFPIYIFIGICFEQWIRRERRWLVSFAIILSLVSPMQILRMLPIETKVSIIGEGKKYLSQEKIPYLKKLLNWSDAKAARDVNKINEILAKLKKNNPHQEMLIMTTDHRIKLSGCPILISYQDKRADYASIFTDEISNRSNPLVLWKIAFEEIKSAINSKDADQVLATAAKYQCQYVVTSNKLISTALQPIYLGDQTNCYHLLPYELAVADDGQ